MTKLLERAVAEAAALPEPEQDALAARILAEIDDERAWDRAFAETTDDDLDNLVAFARSQAGDAIATEEWLRRCEVGEGQGAE